VKARSPAWIIVAGAVLLQASGVVSTVGSALIGIDNTITAVVDLRKVFHKAVVVPFQAIHPVVIPPMKKQMPKKVTQK
jgi:hypothetical protein